MEKLSSWDPIWPCFRSCAKYGSLTAKKAAIGGARLNNIQAARPMKSSWSASGGEVVRESSHLRHRTSSQWGCLLERPRLNKMDIHAARTAEFCDRMDQTEPIISFFYDGNSCAIDLWTKGFAAVAGPCRLAACWQNGFPCSKTRCRKRGGYLFQFRMWQLKP